MVRCDVGWYTASSDSLPFLRHTRVIGILASDSQFTVVFGCKTHSGMYMNNKLENVHLLSNERLFIFVVNLYCYDVMILIVTTHRRCGNKSVYKNTSMPAKRKK